MLNPSVLALGKKRSTIREIFEYGNRRAAQVGRENIFDFSIGNPNVPPPQAVQDALLDILHAQQPTAVHGYTSAQGAPANRKAIADNLNARFGTHYSADQLYLTVGAAASVSICFKALTATPEDEFIVFAPYFPEYLVFIEHGAGAKCVVVYSVETLSRLAQMLTQKSEEYGHPIYLISDEPYREIVYDGQPVPFAAQTYPHTLVCYSYSKSLSLPGERIGYVLVPDVAEFSDLYAAVCGAGRVLGYVNAPSLFQQVAARCAGCTADLSIYAENRRLLYDGLTSMGYACVKPDGAFYLFPRTLEPNDYAFCERAKKYDLLLVPGTDFGAPGHMRISYCVQTETIQRALPLFQKLAEEYR